MVADRVPVRTNVMFYVLVHNCCVYLRAQFNFITFREFSTVCDQISQSHYDNALSVE